MARNKALMSSDMVGMYSATDRPVADAMTSILSQALCIYTNHKASTSTIVDCTAGVGGNTLSFARTFQKVVSVEINKRRSGCLSQNLTRHRCANVQVFNSNVLNLLHTMMFKDVHVFFVDPPWGGNSYKYKDFVSLTISGVKIHEVVRRLARHALTDRVVGIKVPYNFDLREFRTNLDPMVSIVHVCTLPKMLLLVLVIRSLSVS